MAETTFLWFSSIGGFLLLCPSFLIQGNDAHSLNLSCWGQDIPLFGLLYLSVSVVTLRYLQRPCAFGLGESLSFTVMQKNFTSGLPNLWASDWYQSEPIRNWATHQEVGLNVIHVNHPETIPQTRICGKIVFHKPAPSAKNVGDHLHNTFFSPLPKSFTIMCLANQAEKL